MVIMKNNGNEIMMRTIRIIYMIGIIKKENKRLFLCCGWPSSIPLLSSPIPFKIN